jgi:hypothetical protein
VHRVGEVLYEKTEFARPTAPAGSLTLGVNDDATPMPTAEIDGLYPDLQRTGR